MIEVKAVSMGHSNNNVDIMQMLSKAQDEYDKSKQGDASPLPTVTASTSKGSDPKPLIDNPNASATKSTTLIRPLALKVGQSQDYEEGGASGGEPITPSTQISLDALFQRVTNHQSKSPPPAQAFPGLLQRLMSSQGGGATVEEIERQHREAGADRDRMPKPAGAEAPPTFMMMNATGLQSLAASLVNNVAKNDNLVNGNADNNSYQQQKQQGAINKVPSSGDDISKDKEPESPNTALRRTLNIQPRGENPQKQRHHHSRERKAEGSAESGKGLPYRQLSVPGSSIISTGASSTSPSSITTTCVMSSTATTSSPLNTSAILSGQVLRGSPHFKAGSATQGLITPEALMQGVITTTAPATPSSLSSSFTAGTGQGVLGGPLPAVPPPPQSILLTPMVFQQSSGAVRSSPTTAPPLTTNIQALGQPFAAGGLSDSCSNTSLSPCTLERVTTSSTTEEAASSISPLTKQQLQQSLIYLLKNDSGFLTSIHEAYVKSLNQEIISRLEKL